MPRRKRDTLMEESLSPKEPSLYHVLGVESTASHEEIKKAYHKLALRLHPDKNPGDQGAKDKFQSLQNVFGILGDPAKRKVYDQTGSTEDAELSTEAVQNLSEYFRTLYKKVTEKDIDDFAVSYRGSESEKKDLKELYSKCKGDMARVFDQLMCSFPNQDSHRFKDIIENAISSGELKDYNVYKKWATNVSKRDPPSDPLQLPGKMSHARKIDKSEKPVSGLMAIISEREKRRMDSLASMLEVKYGGRGEAKKSKYKFPEPSEEEFEAARHRVMGKKKGKGK